VTYGVGYVELLIFTILPIVVMFVLLYLVIKWAVSSGTSRWSERPQMFAASDAAVNSY